MLPSHPRSRKPIAHLLDIFSTLVGKNFTRILVIHPIMRLPARTLLLALCLADSAPAETRRGPANTGEPWVFRCVLDDRPRVVVAALGDAAWAAWDTQHGALYQAWQPGNEGVKLLGAVYNGEHGPQPATDGKILHREPVGPVWFAPGSAAAIAPAPFRYKGHRLGAPGRVSFAYEFHLGGSTVTVEESPTLKPGAAPSLVRSFRISGLPADGKLALKLTGTPGTWTASGPFAQLKTSADGAYLVFTRNGEAVLTGTWAPPK